MLGLTALDGELFGPLACRDLEQAACRNEDLLGALLHLSTFEDTPEGRGRARQRGGAAASTTPVSTWRSWARSTRACSSTTPTSIASAARFDLVAGSERKQTGSYYTPHALVRS